MVLALLRPESYCTGLQVLESAANDARAAADNARQDAERAEDEVGLHDHIFRTKDWREWRLRKKKADDPAVPADGAEKARGARRTGCQAQGLGAPPESDVSEFKEALLNQAATLGCSPTLEYSNRGEEDLFDDLFTGGAVWFLYEEIPAGRRQGGLTGRGLKGVVDGVLKAFGIRRG